MREARRGGWHDGGMCVPRWRPAHRVAFALLVTVLGIGGALLGLVLGGHARHEVGPVEATFSVTPSLRGDSAIEVPPLGSLSVDSHDGPVQLDIRLDQFNQADAERLIEHPEELQGVANRAADDVRAGVEWLIIQACLCAVGGALLVGLVVFRGWRRMLLCGAVAVGALAATGGTAAATWNAQALREPTYSGLLANAPTVVGNVQNIAQNFSVYRQELAGLVTNVSKLYSTMSTLQAYQPKANTVRVLHVSDLHLNPAAWNVIRSVVQQYKVQVVVDTGDLTDHGIAAENRFVDVLGTLDVPYVYVKGNHDSSTTAKAVAAQPNGTVLNGGETTVAGLTFAGIADPLFTPDKQTHIDEAGTERELTAAGTKLAQDVQGFKRPPDVLLVHDPTMAKPLGGAAPLVLAGHLHRREVERLADGTLLLVEGSTGGAGDRALVHEQPTPLECSVLYFDADSGRLRARDDITLGGLGESTATVKRTVITPPGQGAGAGSTPTP